MNKSLRQLFTIVVALFVILGMSTTIITAIRANQLNNDPRNTRALYHEYGAPRGAILASDGSVIAKSDPSNDAFSYQRSYTAGELYAPVTGYYSYIWSEVLDADTVEWFHANGGLQRANGDRFRDRLLGVGGSKDPLEAYRDFRGRDAEIAPLLARRGLA